MKKQLHSIGLIFFSIIAGYCSAQEQKILEKFSIRETEGKILISCSIRAGSTCNGIEVLRSEDSITFYSIANYSGVCGSSSTLTSYYFIDEQPIINKKSFYKLEMGGRGFSNTLSITIIDPEKAAFWIRPNPAREKTLIYFRNPKNIEQKIVIFNSLGVPVLTKSTNTNVFELKLTNISSGIYTFIISEKIKGKLLVAH